MRLVNAIEIHIIVTCMLKFDLLETLWEITRVTNKENACDWNLSYANRTSTSTVLGIRGNNQSDQFDSSSNVDDGSKCKIDAFSRRNGKKYYGDMHVEVQLYLRVEDEVEPDDYDVGISLDSDVDEDGDRCIRSSCTSSACKSSLDKPVFQLRPIVCSTNIVL